MGDQGPETSLIFQSITARTAWMIGENGKRDTVITPNATLHMFDETQAEELWASITKAVPLVNEGDVALVLDGYSNPEDKKPEMSAAEWIKTTVLPTAQNKAENRRSIKGAKLPLRIALPDGMEM